MCFLSHLVAIVGKPAPDWNGTAVFNGDFQELKLADFKGNEVQSSLDTTQSLSLLFLYCRKVLSFLLLSSGLVSTSPSHLVALLFHFFLNPDSSQAYILTLLLPNTNPHLFFNPYFSLSNCFPPQHIRMSDRNPCI